MVLHNEEQHIKSLTESLLRQSYKSVNYYVLDNCSSDKSSWLIKKYLPTSTYFYSDVNLGFAKGNNLLAKQAVLDGADYIFILNTDMVLDSNCIEEMVLLSRKDDSIGGISPILFFGYASKKNESVIQCYDINIRYNSGKVSNKWTNKIFEYCDLPEIKEVNFVQGGALFYNTRLYEKIGLFEEENYMYGDELELSYKIAKTDYKLFVTQKAKVWHFHDWSKKNKTGYYFMYYYIKRNKLLFLYRHKFYLNIFIFLLKELLLFPFKIKWAIRIADFRLLKYYYLGIWDGLNKRNGKAEINFE